MKITCLSDLHGYFPDLDGGDLLIIAGDLTRKNEPQEYVDFLEWAEAQPYRYKVQIAGNHDGWIDDDVRKWTMDARNFGVHYLQDALFSADGVRIWGSPWTLPYGPFPFMLKEEELQWKYAMIPENIDILVTHGPPKWILDDTTSGQDAGSFALLHALAKVRPKVHVFGHIHEAHGMLKKKWYDDMRRQKNEEKPGKEQKETLCVNCSIMNERYEPVNWPVEIDL